MLFKIGRYEFAMSETGLHGIHTGRPRYLVTCRSCLDADLEKTAEEKGELAAAASAVLMMLDRDRMLAIATVHEATTGPESVARAHLRLDHGCSSKEVSEWECAEVEA